jgi:hypothetical protein
VIDLGDSVPLGITVTDSSGNPANASIVVLTVTQPDGTTVNPPVANPSTGSYTVTFVPTLVGRHSLRWVSTNPASAFVDVFDVASSTPDLIMSLADAREQLRRVPGKSTADDDELRLYIASTSRIIEDIVGSQSIQTRTFVTNGGGSVMLPDAPVTVLSVVENGITLSPATDYVIDYPGGIIRRGTTLWSWSFFGGYQNIVVTYTVGSGVVSENVRLAARIILGHLWSTTGAQAAVRPQLGETSSPDAEMPSPDDIPPAAMALLRPSTPNKQPVIA